MQLISTDHGFTQSAPAAAPFDWVPAAFGFLRRQAPLAGKAALIGTVLAVVYLLITPNKYSATTSLLVDTHRADPFHQQPNSDSQYESAIVDSQVQVLQSEGVAMRVARQLRLRDSDVFKGGFNPIGLVVNTVKSVLPHKKSTNDQLDQMAAQALMRATKVNRVGLSYVIDLTVKTKDPDESARLANAVAQGYIDMQLDAKYDTTRHASTWLQDRLNDLRKQAMAADTAVQQHKARYGIVDTEKGPMDQHELADLSTALTNAHARAADAAAKLDEMRKLKSQDFNTALVSDELQNPVLVKLQQDYLQAAQRAAELEPRFGAHHEVVIQLHQQMDTIRKSLETELDRFLAAYQNDYSVAHASEQDLQRRLDKLSATLAQTNNDRVMLRALESQADTYHTMYSTFLQRYSAAAQDQSFPIAEAQVVTEAQPPLERSWPKVSIVLPGGLVLGLMFGLGLGLLRETLDRKVRTTSQVRNITGQECIAVLPELHWPTLGAGAVRLLAAPNAPAGAASPALRGRTLSSKGSILQAAVQQPLSEYAEAMRRIWARAIQQRVSGSDMKLIGCVSAAAGEGKSTVCANLAHIFARSGTRTLLIDGDLRKPSLSTSMIGNRAPGLFDIAEGRISLTDAVWTDSDTGLHFLPAASSVVAHPTEMLGSPAMRRVLTELRQNYDYVILDLPPMSPVADSQAIADLIDAFVLVVEWGHTEEASLSEALRHSGFGADRLLGTVINRASERAIRDMPHYGGGAYGQAA